MPTKENKSLPEVEGFLPIEEGRTHINIYSKSTIALGRTLSNFAHTPFVCPVYGQFQSLEGYWYYAKLRRFGNARSLPPSPAWERLRNEIGIQAKQAGKALLETEYDYKEEEDQGNFRSLILEATRCKLRQNHELRRKLGESRLPLTHYYYFGSIEKPNIVRLPQHQWQIDEILRCRTLLQQQQQKSKT